MSHKAVEIFMQIPRTHNCAQAVAAGCGRTELVDELCQCGAGRAPEGVCGALYAAQQMVDASQREALAAGFAAKAGSIKCREIKQIHGFPCAECVRLAAELAEKYGA